MKRDNEIDAELKALEERKRKLLKIVKLRREVSALEMSSGAVAYMDTINCIITEVCLKFGITRDAMLSRGREHQISSPRQVAYFITRKFDGIPFHTIAQAFGKNHATILHGCKAIQNRLDTEPRLKSIVDELTTACRNKLAQPNGKAAAN